MTYIARAALFCDRCGARQECEPSPKPPIIPISPDEPLSGWMNVDKTHHLCPKCAGEYKRKEAEMQAELKKFAGIRDIHFDL